MEDKYCTSRPAEARSSSPRLSVFTATMTESLVASVALKVSRALNLPAPNAQLAKEVIRAATVTGDFAAFARSASEYGLTNDNLQRQLFHQIKGFESALKDEQRARQDGGERLDNVKLEARPSPASSPPLLSFGGRILLLITSCRGSHTQSTA